MQRSVESPFPPSRVQFPEPAPGHEIGALYQNQPSEPTVKWKMQRGTDLVLKVKDV
jgi:hypothetical protein